MSRDWQHFKCSKCGKLVEGYGCKDWTTWPDTNYHENYEPEICSDCYKELRKNERVLHIYEVDSPLTEFYVWKGFDQFIQDLIADEKSHGREFDVFKMKQKYFKQIERGDLKIREMKSPNYLRFWSEDLSLFDEIDLPVRHSERV